MKVTPHTLVMDENGKCLYICIDWEPLAFTKSDDNNTNSNGKLRNSRLKGLEDLSESAKAYDKYILYTSHKVR